MPYFKKSKKSIEFLKEANIIMDKCTHEVRMEYWKNIIIQCQNRPEGQSVKQWLKGNGICEATYYLWQKKIRQHSYEQMTEDKQFLSAPQKTEEITFAEIPIPQSPNIQGINLAESSIHPVAVIKNEKISIALSGDIPHTLLAKIIQEVSHA